MHSFVRDFCTSFQVNNIDVFTPHFIDECKINIGKDGGNLIVYSEECGIEVKWDGDSKLITNIPKEYGPYATGLCGNCDGVQDQYVLSDGTDVSGKQKRLRDIDIAEEYEVLDDTGDQIEE